MVGISHLSPYRFSYYQDQLVKINPRQASHYDQRYIFYRGTVKHDPHSPRLTHFVILTHKSQVKQFSSCLMASRWLKKKYSTKLTVFGVLNRLRRHPKRPMFGYVTHHVTAKYLPERWRPIPGFKGYRISNRGHVMSDSRIVYRGGIKVHRNAQTRKLSYSPNGFLRVMLHENGHAYGFDVNELVARAFIPNPHHYTKTCHKDENKFNNYANNIKWCTQDYIIHYGYRTAKTYRPVAILTHNRIHRFVSLIEAAQWIRKQRHLDKSLAFVRSYLSGYLIHGYHHGYFHGMKIEYLKDL